MPKSSVTPFAYYTFRYDYTDAVLLDKIVKYIMREFPKYAIFDEISEVVGKSHAQGKIGKSLSIEQVRKHFHKEFPGVFIRTNYSITLIKDEDAYDSYICKDGKVLCNNVFDNEYIDAQIEKHKQCKSEAKEKKIKIETKLSNQTFTQSVFMGFKNEHFDYYNHIKYAVTYKPTEDETMLHDIACERLLAYLLKRLGNIVKVFDDTVLQRMYTGVKNAILVDGLESMSSGEFKLVSQYKKRIQL